MLQSAALIDNCHCFFLFSLSVYLAVLVSHIELVHRSPARQGAHRYGPNSVQETVKKFEFLIRN